MKNFKFVYSLYRPKVRASDYHTQAQNEVAALAIFCDALKAETRAQITEVEVFIQNTTGPFYTKLSSTDTLLPMIQKFGTWVPEAPMVPPVAPVTTPHKHAALIKAWADGAAIEYKGDDNTWWPAATPAWEVARDCRVKPRPHKHAALMEAFNNGAVIQFKSVSGTWRSAGSPNWGEDVEYRIKPENYVTFLAVNPRPNDTRARVYIAPNYALESVAAKQCDDPNSRVLRIEIDPDTMELVSATMVKP